VNERALILLLEEWHRQLLWGLQSAIDALPDPEPERVRVWNTGIFSFALPTEHTAEDKWHWEDRPRTPPMLVGLEATITRIGEQIERLRGSNDS
jgi:hypothetical protein